MRDEIRGAGKLVIEATKGVTDLVQEMHGAIGGVPARILSAPVYASIRGVTSLVGGVLDLSLSRLPGDAPRGADADALRAALNGVLGDHLAATKNPLAIEMRLHRTETAPAKPRLVVFVHGSSMNRHAWQAACELDATPVHLDYNSGLHISTNGRAFAALLDELVASWPMPVEAITIIAHSMGGLITRSACHYAEASNLAWRDKLRSIVFLGTPHHGAPLERVGNLLQSLLGITRYSAPFARLGKIRSAGVTDLRFGYVIDEHWEGRDRFAAGTDARTPVPLPAGVACYTIAAERDGLVPRASAMGRHDDPTLELDFPESHRFVADGTGHLDMLQSPAVWERIEGWLAPAVD
jgi:pimeloyl-ACP methyl ester carboxylesterase